MGLRPALSIRSPCVLACRARPSASMAKKSEPISPNERLKIGVRGDADAMPNRL